MAPSPDVDPDFAPIPVIQIRDADTLKALSDPTRMRVLEVMASRPDRAWSAKELAAALGVPQTRLYHHIEVLTERGLLKGVEQRVVSGIIETRYRVAARSFQLDRRLFSGDADELREVLSQMLEVVFDRSRAEIEATALADPSVLSKEAPTHRQVLLSRAVARLSPARAEEFRRRLGELEDSFDAADPEGAAEAEGTGPYGMVVALYPLAAAPED